MDLLVTLAGELAQRRADPDGGTLVDAQGRSRAKDDGEKAQVAINRHNHQADILDTWRVASARMKNGQQAASDLVSELWPIITELADGLLAAGGKLTSEEIDGILSREFPEPRRRTVALACAFANRGQEGE